MDATQQAFVETFRTFLEGINSERTIPRLTPLGRLVSDHLGVDAEGLPVVREQLVNHRLVDADIAVAELADADPDSRLFGINGGRYGRSESFADLLVSPHFAFGPGAVDYVEIATGPDDQRQVVAYGVRLLRVEGRPVAVLQTAAHPEHGQQNARLDVLTADAETSGAVLGRIRRLMRERSVLRGQVITFAAHEYDDRANGATFVVRPSVSADDVVLPPGVLDRVVAHVVGIGDHRAELLAAGRHLKRGVLLYGPPGTGKTLTVRHLIARTPGTTVVLLTGPAIRFIGEATDLARALPPAMVVLEDIDLIAQDRDSYGPQPLLFALLDALDGLDGDADVAFVMTTNRVELLERALAERPGRVDLAVPIGLPDAEARTRLFTLYAHGLPLSADALATAAHRAEGTTASFAKELMRRVVLAAVRAGEPVTDATLAAVLEDLLSSQEELTRSLLGGSGSLPVGSA